GYRIGPISLGMTVKDLYLGLGNPASSRPGNGSTWYGFNGLEAEVFDSTQKVHRIVVESPSFATKEGIRVGASDLAARTALGNPARVRPREGGGAEAVDVCFAQGVM